LVQTRTNEESIAGSAGHHAAFSALVHRQSPFLYRVAFSLLRNPQDAEDAVQETFLKLYRTAGWLEMDDERAFLARAVWRVGLTRLSRSGVTEMRQAADVTGMEIAASGQSPEDQAVGQSERSILHRLIDGLPEELRQPLLLSAIEGMTSAEVAVTLGIPDGTVRTRVMRARNELKRRFAGSNTGSREVRR
jgi:RNA polymerase sigma-70 factor (ECF subfamily)